MGLTDIITDDGPGERRAAQVENGCIVALYLHRHADLMLGQTGEARLVSKSRTGHFLKTQTGHDLLLRGPAPETEGTTLSYRVTREAIAEPGLIKRAEAKRAQDDDPHETPDTLWVALVNNVAHASDTNGAISDALSVAQSGTSIAGPAQISFQRTKAGLVFDVDGDGDPLAINLAAAADIARLLRLYQVGGMAMIDFVAVNSKPARLTIADAFDAASCADVRPFERSAVNGFGLMQIVRPRPRPSVLDQLFGTRIASLSDETQALWLLREAMGGTGIGPRTITATPGVASLITQPSWAQYRAEIERSIGATLSVIADPVLRGYGHVHARQA
jgi:ribonuclease G